MKSKHLKLLRAINNYFVFFLLVAFVVTCCTMLFVNILSRSLGVELTSENLATSAKVTFLNVILVSVLLTVIDALRRKWAIDRPVKRISEATDKMIKGDFNVRIEPASAFADDRFNEIIECINKMAEELSSVETLRTDFIANVSHEMKTPLAIMKSYAKLLEAKDLSEEKRIEYAQAISDASARLSNMMTNILKLSRLENQQIYPNAKTYDLGEQLCECLLQYESIWEKKKIEISTEIEENVKVCVDNELLELVWSNLFSNAFKFTDEGGEVTVSLNTENGLAIVKIKDTGCGISPEEGAHIFEKFYQADTSHATQGNGLGLALVKRVVDIVGADISVSSVLGEGTEFVVRIKMQ
ncbi:MAG: HAMP domain-containing histidine kinase [Clostridia bacterium]|nr:HAMP domain-containing histidine kinase [Clostridia bacterium]